MQDLEAGHAALEQMLRRVGVAYRSEDRTLLLAYGNEIGTPSGDLHDRFEGLYEAAYQGFFHCAADGVAFVPVGSDGGDFDLSLEDNYPGAGAAFQRFATSYWTLRVLEGRVARRYAGVGLQQILCGIEARIARLVFLDPDADPLEPSARAAEQRRAITESGAPIRIEEFLLGNPLLFGNPLA